MTRAKTKPRESHAPLIRFDRLRELRMRLNDKTNPPPATEAEDWQYVHGVMVDLGLTRAEFIEVDERPGQFGYSSANGGEWFYRLRRWRNHARSFRTWWHDEAAK